MRLLCLDIGSGTQDILLLDTSQPVGSAIQLILPAPTVVVARAIEKATARGQAILLVGETMGGGACTSALKRHLEAGLRVEATPEAARSFSDDLEKVSSWGVHLVSSDEAGRFQAGETIVMGDVALDLIQEALAKWDVELKPDVIAVAVLDHGAAPRGQSERLFRFRQLEHLLQRDNSLVTFAFTEDEVPEHLTRMKAVVRSIDRRAPVVLMDTGAAAVLGASLDRVVAAQHHRLAVNLGNSHTIAFLLSGYNVLGLFEHHTSLLSLGRLETLMERLISGELKLDQVWEEGGHGSLTIAKGSNPFVVATGPRRAVMASSRYQPYFAAPFGSMMLSGCYGLAKAAAIKLPQWRSDIEKAFASQ